MKWKDLERMVMIYFNVVEGYNVINIVDELRGFMSCYDLLEGFIYEFIGE